jgi:hypothetical protein
MGAVEPSAGTATGPSPGGAVRRFLPVALLVAVMGAIVFGGFAVAAMVARPAGPPLTVGGAVRVLPLGGWQVGGGGPNASSALLSRGGGNLEIRAFAAEGDPAALLRGYVTRILEPQARRLSVSPTVQRIRLASGLPAVRIAYVGLFDGVQGQLEGELTATTGPRGVGVVFDGWAPVGLLPYVVDDIRSMVDTAVVG